MRFLAHSITALIVAATLLVSAATATVAASVATTTSIRPPLITYGYYETIHMLALVRPTPDDAGLVTLFRGGQNAGEAYTSPNGAANFTLLGGLAPGTYTFVAVFAGTADSEPSTSEPFDLTVIDDRTPLTVTVSSGTDPSLRGDSVPFTITVDPVPDTGQVSVYHDGSSTQEPLDPSGTNVINHRIPNDGTFTVHACFGGSTLYQDTCTSVGVQQDVIAYDTTTTLSIEPMSLYIDEGLLIQVQVDPAPDTPADVIVRRMWDPALWSIPLDPVTGIGELEVAGEDVAARLRWGENELIAQYGGSDHMNQSNSDTIVVFGKRDATTVDVDVETSTIAVGGSVTATAVVVPAPPEGTILDFFLRGGPNETHLSGYASTDGDGVATETIAAGANWPVGDYEVEVRFRGDLRLVPSEGSVPFTIAYLDSIPPSLGFVLSGPDPWTPVRDIIVTSGVNGTGSPVVGAELSHDGETWASMPYAHELPWTLTDGDGLKTVWLRVTDAGGNVSPAGYFTITLDTGQPTASLSVAAGAASTKTTAVALSTAATDALSGVSHVALSNNGTAWTTRPYAATQNWTLPATNGTRTVHAKWRDQAGNWSSVKTDTIVLDTVAPTVTAPGRGLVPGTAVSSGAVTVRIPWSGSDATSGIARYELAQQTDGGAWTTVVTTLTSPISSRMLATEHAYGFRVRAIDQAGNIGSWVSGPTFRVSRYSETNPKITYAGAWSIVKSRVFWGGQAKKATVAGAKASITFTGRSIAWVARTGPDRGKAELYVGGTKVATVDLHSATYQDQRVVWVGSFSSSTTWTVSVKVLATSGRPRVDLDAFVTVN